MTTTTTVRTTETGPTGARIFRAGGLRWLWAGPGAGLRMEWAPDAWTTVEAIEGLTAATPAEARELVREALASFTRARDTRLAARTWLEAVTVTDPAKAEAIVSKVRAKLAEPCEVAMTTRDCPRGHDWDTADGLPRHNV